MERARLDPAPSTNLAWSAPLALILFVVVGVMATMPQFTWAQLQPPQASVPIQSPVTDASLTGDQVTYLPVVTRYYCASYPCPIYHEDFSDPSSGWPREHSDYGKVEIHRDYEDGTYHMTIVQEWFTAIYAIAPNVTLPDNYIAQFDMRYDFSDYRADWGIVFSATGDPGACYMATANRYGIDAYYAVRRLSANGKETSLDSGGAKGLLKNNDKWRTLRVIRQGDSINFEAYKSGEWVRINVRDIHDATLSHGGVGFRIFSSEMGAEAWFDNLYVWDLGP